MKRNQSCSISGRGKLIEDRKSRTKNSGKKPCTVSPEPERSPTNAPSAANASATSIASASSAGMPSRPASKSMPAAKPTAM